MIGGGIVLNQKANILIKSMILLLLKIIKRIGGKLIVIPVAKRVKDIVSNIEIIKSVR